MTTANLGEGNDSAANTVHAESASAVPSLLGAFSKSQTPMSFNGLSTPTNNEFQENSQGSGKTSTDFSDLPQYGATSSIEPGGLDPQQQQLLLQQQFVGNGLPDLNAMMFPSADPFAYPKQPMTILENRHWQHQQQLQQLQPPFNPASNTMTNPETYGTTNDPTGMPVYDSLGEQLFAPLPTYIMQSQGPDQAFGPAAENAAFDLPIDATTFPNQPAQSFDFPPGMNVDEMFGGEEWRTNFFMSQDFRGGV